MRDRTVRSFLAELSPSWLKRKLARSGESRSPKQASPQPETPDRKAHADPLRRTAVPAHRPPPPDLNDIASHL